MNYFKDINLYFNNLSISVFDLNSVIPDDILRQNILSKKEKSYLNNKKMRNERKIRWIKSRYFIKQVLKKIWKCNSYETSITYDAFGRPLIINEKIENQLFISISHTDNLLAFTIWKDPDLLIGVDIEKVKNVNYLNKFFKEKKGLKSNYDLLALWTVKESIYKAINRVIQNISLADIMLIKNTIYLKNSPISTNFLIRTTEISSSLLTISLFSNYKEKLSSFSNLFRDPWKSLDL